MNKFTLICCSANTTPSTFIKFLDGLKNQIYKNFELIIIDQNKDERLNKIISQYQRYFDIKHIKSGIGLSYGRNVGIDYIAGDIVSFPDDDCYYDNTTLDKVNSFFLKKRYDILAIKPINSYNNGINILNNVKSQMISKNNVIPLMYSISTFYAKNVIIAVGKFDENLGLGAKTIFQGHEDHDYPLRALQLEFKLYFENSIYVYHPWGGDEEHKNLLARAFNGGASKMYLLNKHNFPLSYKIKQLIRSFLVIIYYLIIKKNLYRTRSSILIFKGMISCWNVRKV